MPWLKVLMSSWLEPSKISEPSYMSEPPSQPVRTWFTFKVPAYLAYLYKISPCPDPALVWSWVDGKIHNFLWSQVSCQSKWQRWWKTSFWAKGVCLLKMSTNDCYQIVHPSSFYWIAHTSHLLVNIKGNTCTYPPLIHNQWCHDHVIKKWIDQITKLLYLSIYFQFISPTCKYELGSREMSTKH